MSKAEHTLDIITMSGRRHHGKDTTANDVQALLAMYKDGDIPLAKHSKRVAFADPIARATCDILNVPYEDYHQVKQAEFIVSNNSNVGLPVGYTISGRDVVIGAGMKMREYDENQFVEYVRKCMEELHHYISEPPNSRNVRAFLIVTDVRFDNEVQWLSAVDGNRIVRWNKDEDDQVGTNIRWHPLWIDGGSIYDNLNHVTEKMTPERMLDWAPSVGIIDNTSYDRKKLRNETRIALKQRGVLPYESKLDAGKFKRSRWVNAKTRLKSKYRE